MYRARYEKIAGKDSHYPVHFEGDKITLLMFDKIRFTRQAGEIPTKDF